MSFLYDPVSANFIRNKWQHPTLKGDPAHANDADAWRVVPTDTADLFEWLKVIIDPGSKDPSRPYVVVYQEDDDDEYELVEVTIRLQGFLGIHELRPVGNWNGTLDGACRAFQHIVLECHGHDTPWAQTLASFYNVLGVISSAVNQQQPVPLPNTSPRPNHLSMQHRVFDKVFDDCPPGLMTAADPDGKLEAIAHSWRLGGGAVLQTIDRNKKLKKATFMDFSVGDFVDTTVSFDIHRPKTGLSRIHLKINRLVQITPKSAAVASHRKAVIVRRATGADDDNTA